MTAIKQKLTSALLLCYLHPWSLYVLNIDASGESIGGVLLQALSLFEEGKGHEISRFSFKDSDLHPIVYESCHLNDTEKHYSARVEHGYG